MRFATECVITIPTGAETVLEELSDWQADHELIAPISVPDTHRIPDHVTGRSTSDEYDRYFRLRRCPVDLVEWTQTCSAVQQEIVQDLDGTSLDEEDRRAILVGLVTVQHITLSHWMSAVAELKEPAS